MTPEAPLYSAVVVTCEHAGRRVPAVCRDAFATARAGRALASHRGFDRGALAVARSLAASLHAPLVACLTTRLAVEVNRSPTHPRLFSEFTRPLDLPTRQRLLDDDYRPHRDRVARTIRRRMRRGRVLHLGVHSFARRLAGRTRNADVGLLYDPSRPAERALCRRWAQALRRTTSLRVRRNYPYLGRTDGLTTTLRRTFPAAGYLGIEIELNQRLLADASATTVNRIARILVATLASTATSRR